MTSFVRVLGIRQKKKVIAEVHEDQQSKGLTVDEIFRNVFIINFAGYDTTANTLAFSILLLATNPEVQDWVGEEIREITVDDHSKDWDYIQVFSNLKRCRAVLICIASLELQTERQEINLLYSSKFFTSLHPS